MKRRTEMTEDRVTRILGMMAAALPVRASVDHYFDQDSEQWSVKGEVSSQKSRTIVIDQTVIDRETDWDLLMRDLARNVAEEFRHSGGCVIRVHAGRGRMDPGGFYLRLDTLDGRPRSQS